MVLWHVTSYRDGLRLEHDRLREVSRLQQAYGRWLWRCRAPLGERLALRLTQAEAMAAAAVASEPAPASSPASVPAAELLDRLPGQCMIEPPKTTTAPLSKRTQRLIEATAAILDDADRHDSYLSQAALARELRERGHRVANDRLRWLVAMARAATSSATANANRSDCHEAA
jgi:hypothetical protein